jgi:hypothetical protein
MRPREVTEYRGDGGIDVTDRVVKPIMTRLGGAVGFKRGVALNV